MSLNHIVDQEYKLWLDPYINSIKIDGEWGYKELDKANGDNLVLDADLVAQWQPVNTSTTPYGNGIALRFTPQLLFPVSYPVFLTYLAPFSPTYSFSTGNAYIRINETGVYCAFANLSFKDNLVSANNMKIQISSAGSFVDVPGSYISSFPGTVLFNNNNSLYPQELNICTVAVINVTTAGSLVRVSAAGGSTIDPNYSTFTVLKLA